MIPGLLKNRFIDLKYIIRLFKNHRKLHNTKFSFALFFLFWIFYPVSRLFLGREKASSSIVRRFMKGNLIIPVLMESCQPRFIGIRDITDFDAFREVCIEDHYNFAQLKPGMIVVDLGAHIGLFALPASFKVGREGKIIAIEPEMENFKKISENLALNKIDNVILVNIGISDSNGEEDFFIHQSYGSHSFFRPESFIDKIRIKVKTLDSLLDELKIDKVDMIKIDTEGAEMKILKGAKETLANNPKIKMAIAAYHYPKETEEVVNYLKKLNFSPEISRGQFGLVLLK